MSEVSRSMSSRRGHSPAHRRQLSLILLGAMLLCAPGIFGASLADSPVSAAAASREYQVKAAFIYNFTKFIEWPPQSFPGAGDPIVIGVLGDSPFDAELVQVVRNRNVNGRGIVVKPVETAAEARSTHLLFVSADQNALFGEIEPAIAGSPILTIGESRSFASSGGTINFVLEDDKVRFEINMDSAERAGLRISAQLQKLAKVILKSS